MAVDELRAGDIGCTVKLKDVKTGNTLNGKDVDNKFDFIKYPNSKFSRAIKAVNEAETEKMMAAMVPNMGLSTSSDTSSSGRSPAT